MKRPIWTVTIRERGHDFGATKLPTKRWALSLADTLAQSGKRDAFISVHRVTPSETRHIMTFQGRVG